MTTARRKIPAGDAMTSTARTEPPSRVQVSAGRSALLPGPLAAPWLPLLLLCATIAGSALLRPILAGVDTPALSAAWEMIRDGTAGPETMPPLLPRLIAFLWSANGVGTGAAWAICAAGMALGLLATRRLARELWPQRADAPALASWGYFGSAAALVLGPAIAPEALGVGFAAAGLTGLALASAGRGIGWPLYAAALALLLPTAGPLACLALIAPAALAPAWAGPRAARRWFLWYLAFVAACVPALVTAMSWESPDRPPGGWLSLHGSPSLLPILALPAVLYPWPFWPRFWRSVRRQPDTLSDRGIRFCLIAAAATLAAVAAEGAELRGLLLLAPPVAALIARLLAGRLPGRADFHAAVPGLPLVLLGFVPVAINTVPLAQLALRADELFGIEEPPIWIASIGVGGTLVLLGGVFLLAQASPRLMLSRAAQVALLPLILAAAILLEMSGALGRAFDLSPVAARLAQLQSEDRPVALYGIEPSDYVFAGRLERPLYELRGADEALGWARDNPGGMILAPFRGSVLHLIRQPAYAAPQGARWVALWPAEAVTETNAAVLIERF
jgi:hypothetical protein